jgi:glutamine amidotransferase/cyclase
MPMLKVLEETSKNVFVPLTIGGGIRDYTDSNGRVYSSGEKPPFPKGVAVRL